jgi:hypothetical protein
VAVILDSNAVSALLAGDDDHFDHVHALRRLAW